MRAYFNTPSLILTMACSSWTTCSTSPAISAIASSESWWEEWSE